MLYATDWRRNTAMKQYRIEMTELAEQDLENAGDYIAYQLKNPDAAERIVRGIRKQVNLLTNFPERNELDEDESLAELGVRKDYYRNYKIYYVIDEDIIHIVRILNMLVDSSTCPCDSRSESNETCAVTCAPNGVYVAAL